jgi:putative ABC transport system ATP-binding protein
MQNEGKGSERVKRAAQTGIRRQEEGTAMNALVKLNQVSKSFIRGKEELHVLNDIDLAIEKGDFFALMGPSGSGKTTLLNLIGGLDTTTAGYVQVGDTRLDELSSKELARWRSEHVGFVFQFYNLLPVLTAQRNVELPLLLTRLSRSQRKSNAATALKVVGLEDRADHRPGELSGGQQQRVAIARAFVADPEILVCDEPTGDLDRDTADEILGLLELLNRDHGKTIIMVTHDPKAAEHASHVLHLDKGRLVDQVST